MGRQGKKMIGIYVDEALYDEIKQSASEQGKSIKDYLIDLHSGPKSDTVDILVERLKQELKQGDLRDALSSLVRTATPASSRLGSEMGVGSAQRPQSGSLSPSSSQLSSPLSSPLSSQSNQLSNSFGSQPSSPLSSPLSSQSNPPKILQIPKFVNYLASLNNRRQREAISETLQVIVNHGGSTTSSVIKRERGFTRTTIANRQLNRLIEDGIIIKDDSVTPFVVTLVPEWQVY